MAAPHDHQTSAAFLPAIVALRSELADLERRAAETRALIEQLCARAGIADERAAPPGEARATASGSPQVVAPTKGDDKASADELRKVAATIAELSAEVQSATREKDAAKLTLAIEAVSRAQRTAGALLVAMGGRVKLPVSRQEAKFFRRAAALNEANFEAKLDRAKKRALAAIRVPEKKAPRKPEARTRVANRPSPRAAPGPTMQLTPWKKEPDGSLSRTLTAADGEAPGSTAGA